LFAAQVGGETYTNRLINSHDPYLQLHAHNPVDWYPWGPEALEKARRENKPIFVSIGYSTCYWCHVAEREIYSNPQIAKLMNQWFINIKIDREERPDIDQIYMLATEVMTGHGGWPNNVFLTPDLKPFFAGSYFPPEDQGGRSGFPRLLNVLHRAWVEDNDQVLAEASRVYKILQRAGQEVSSASADNSSPAIGQWLDQAIDESAHSFDHRQGGFGGGTAKFPRAPQLSMLLASSTEGHQAKALKMVTDTLDAMAHGGIMDQLGAGFHRYSTEPSWSIPHFEKMLYDNAQLLGIYAQAYKQTKKPLFRQVTLRTAHYLMTEMQAPGGGFFSAQDAEAGGVEGASYVWSKEQIESVLGTADTKRFFSLYTLTPLPDSAAGREQPLGGVLRLKAADTLNLAQTNKLAAAIETLAPLRDKLLVARQARVQPKRDEKIITSDNALAVIGFAQAGQALDETRLTETAVRTADWLWQYAFDPESGELQHQFFQGHAGVNGFLDDYGILGSAFMKLLKVTGESRWQSRARLVADAMLLRFAQPSGALTSSWDTSNLLVAPPIKGDSVKPSGHSAAIGLLLELTSTTHEMHYAVAARRALTQLYRQVATNPSGWGGLLTSLNEKALRVALDDAAKVNTLASINASTNSADHVHASGQWLTSNQAAELILKLNIDTGYHINANPATDPDLIPTELLVDGRSKIVVDYPEPQTFNSSLTTQGIAIYQGKVTLRAHLPLTQISDLPEVSLRIQACTDEFCLAPSTMKVPISK